VVRRFGEDLHDQAGGIDRARLAAIVFADPDALADLNAISHPLINAQLDALAAAAPPDSIVVYDMAVLVESSLGTGIEHGYELVVNVEAPEAVRIARLAGRGVPADEARRRIGSQASDEERRAVAQFVVANGGDLETLRHVVGELWATLQRLADEKRRPVA
jgi:dephospho-CoA kinase